MKDKYFELRGQIVNLLSIFKNGISSKRISLNYILEENLYNTSNEWVSAEPFIEKISKELSVEEDNASKFIEDIISFIDKKLKKLTIVNIHGCDNCDEVIKDLEEVKNKTIRSVVIENDDNYNDEEKDNVGNLKSNNHPSKKIFNEVVKLKKLGMKNRDIARELNLTDTRVFNHIKKAKSKGIL